MYNLDDQEKAILRALVRDPRDSDNGVGVKTGVNVRTVSRKRQKLEEAGVLSYFANVDHSVRGTAQYPTRHLYIIKFNLGISYEQLVADIQREPFVRSIFTEVIFESHIAEIDGHLAMVLTIEGTSDTDLVHTVQAKLVPSLHKNHGQDCILEIKTIRLLSPVRMLRNYVVPVNMENGYLRKDWPEEAIYVGK